MSVFDYPAMLFKMFLPKKEKTLHFPEIGWTITIPKNFDLLNDKKMERQNNRGIAIMEALTEKKINYPGKNKFTAVHELQDVFSSDFTDLRSLPEMVWEKQVADLQNAMLSSLYISYKTFAHVSITTATDARQKGNITFNTFEIVITTPQRELDRVRFFTTVYKDYGILIYMNFTETLIGEQMLTALRNSTFS